MKKQSIVSLVLAMILAIGMPLQALGANISTETTSSTQKEDSSSYTTLREVDKGTYNEYRYYMVREYFKLKEYYDLNERIDPTLANNLLKFARSGYNYLPDSLVNQRLLNDLSIAVQRGVKSPNSEVNYNEIVKKLSDYIENANIQKMKGSIEASPNSGNAPLNTTFRARITDPTGTVIPANNYLWWTTANGKRVVLGRGPSINYTFRDEGNFTVFLDVKSAHKNAAGYTDVISYQSRSTVQVKEKIASLIIKVNSLTLKNNDEIKFTPDESSYGLIFDATSSTPTGGARFTRTEWDFGNGVVRRYDGAPRIERVIYSREGNYSASLKLFTNEGRTIERKFSVFIHKPIASIAADKTDGYIGEKFSFSTVTSVNEKNLSFTWNVIDISNDKIIKQYTGNVFSHSFEQKGRYNIQLKVKDAAGNEDSDTQIIHVNSRAPVAEFAYSIPNKSKPNRVLLDGTKSFDSDITDAGKLKYRWNINGEIVNIENIDTKGAIGYYTFDSIGDQNVTLEVSDPDDMTSTKSQKVRIDSILEVDLATYPRVVQRGGYIKFVASAPSAKIYEWDFGDGSKENGSSGKIDHVYAKSGIYNVKLTVRDSDGAVNDITKTVYVGESNEPYALIGLDYGNSEKPEFDATACNGGAYVVDRTKTIQFKGGESLDINGETTGLTYSWKIGYDKFISSQNTTFKFNELGCFPVKLTVKSNKNGALSTTNTWVKVKNLAPVLTNLDISIQNDTTDPVIVNLVANGAMDPDGVVQSYLWYYYTDTDPDPQDFRTTIVPNTTFVIPKITGNYYFVVVMRDNNDERFSSESLSDAKYFVTLSGDNINTPLVDFKVNQNSVMINDSVVFTASAKNVLGQDITAKAEYAWDFDGDGFYDKETKEPTIEHNYQTSGTFYAKVRVKYKGMTNVRTIEMNVANVLEPNFEYTSLGDKYLFFNTSLGKVDSVVWDMGDGNKVYDKNYFTYTYEDGKPSHQVEIKITEGTKVRNKTLTVVKNVKNMIASKNAQGLVVYSYPEIVDDEVILNSQNDKLYLYLGDSKGEFQNYGVDFDIESDSDLNGGKDDDVDNKTDASFTDGVAVEVTLNTSKTQKVRVFLLGADGKVVESKDITVQKPYVKEETVDLNTLTFAGVSDTEKTKIEKVKSYVQDLPQEHRLKGMQYVQKLQENWFYPTEKTKIILEFEAFIDGTGVANALEINNTLESLLVEGQEDQSVRNMAYNVVKNLIPKELVEYNDIMANLDAIAASPESIEENKVLGKEILEMIKTTSLITNDDKLTIKNQLQVFIYGSVDNIPEEIKQEVKNEEPTDNKFVGLFSGVVKVIAMILGGIILIVVGFYIWYKTTNKNENQGLQDFIIEKTNFEENPDDVLAQATPEVAPVAKPQTSPKVEAPKAETPKEEVPSKAVVDEKIPSWLAGAVETPKVETPTETPKQEEKKEEVVPVVEKPSVKLQPFEQTPVEDISKKEEAKVPDWLAGAMETPVETPKVETKKEEILEVETKVEEAKVPDWLAGAMDTPVETPKVETKKEEILEVETKVEDAKVPDWLAGAMDTPVETPKVETKKEEILEVETKKEEILEVETKVEEAKVPDWLAGAISVDNLAKKQEKPKAEPVQKTESKKIPTQEKPKVSKPLNPISTDSVEEVLKPKKTKTPQKTETKKEELWNDGMDVPDWLKTDAQTPATKSSKKKKDEDIWTIDAIKTDEESEEDTKK